MPPYTVRLATTWSPVSQSCMHVGRDGRHAAGRAVAGLRAFVRGDLATEHVDRRIEVPAVQVAAARVRPKVALEDLGHRGRAR